MKSTIEHLKKIVVAGLLLAAVTTFGATRNVPSQYSTIQAAINASVSGDTIEIANGTYNEQDTIPNTLSNLTLIGASQTGVIIQSGTNQTTMTVHGNNITFEYMTIANTLWVGSLSSHAVYVDSQRVEFYRCYINGWQDTFAIWNGALVYCNLSEIRGEVDFIYSGGTAFFNDCNIRQCNTTGGYNCAPSTPSTARGFIFWNCTVCRTGNVETNSSWLMRPWYPNGETAYINCAMDVHIAPAGWAAWGTNQDTCRAAEYGSTTLTGQTINLATRSSWCVRLTSTTNYTEKVILGSWTPPL